MKTYIRASSIVVSGVCLLFGFSAHAQILGINSAASSTTIKFLDNNSFNGPNPGSVYNNTLTPWPGSLWTLSQTDPTTFDSANGDISASGAGTSYNISLNNISLTQPVGNTGYADLTYTFFLEFNIGASGLISLPTSFPNFLISGTIQNVAGSYASVNGNIVYYGVDASGAYGPVEQVAYNYFNNTPGSFLNVPISGVASNGVTPALGPNTVFDLVGNITFEVDPAHIEIFDINLTPEPTIAGLAAVGSAVLVAARRRLARRS